MNAEECSLYVLSAVINIVVLLYSSTSGAESTWLFCDVWRQSYKIQAL